MIWVLGAGGWGLAVLLLLVVRGRLELVADAEHELRGAAAAIGLAAERMGRVGATRPFASLVALQLDRMNAALTDLTCERREYDRDSPPRRRGGYCSVSDQQVAGGRNQPTTPHDLRRRLRPGRCQ